MRSFIFFAALFLICSCSVEEGEGGRATITGKVFVTDFNMEGTNILVEDYAPDWDVYIVYGDDDGFSDNTTTHYDGTYVFEYLYEGNYEVYAYSKCDACPNNIEPIIIQTEITSPDQVVELEDINVRD